MQIILLNAQRLTKQVADAPLFALQANHLSYSMLHLVICMIERETNSPSTGGSPRPTARKYLQLRDLKRYKQALRPLEMLKYLQYSLCSGDGFAFSTLRRPRFTNRTGLAGLAVPQLVL
jgi:hypothetical protein